MKLRMLSGGERYYVSSNSKTVYIDKMVRLVIGILNPSRSMFLYPDMLFFKNIPVRLS